MSTGTRVLFVYAANHAEVVNGLIYVNGGGWTNVQRQIRAEGRQLVQMGAIVALIVPWMELGQPHEVTIEIEAHPSSGPSGHAVATVKLSVLVGAQRFTREGVNERIMLAVPITVDFPAAGDYCLVADVDDSGERKEWEFWVHDIAATGRPRCA
jgi:pimeloyl-ACP methyl ester carboxylesterase